MEERAGERRRLCPYSSNCPSPRTPSSWGEEGENLLTPRRFRQILIECNSALRLGPPFRIRLPSFVCLLGQLGRGFRFCFREHAGQRHRRAFLPFPFVGRLHEGEDL